MLLAGLGFPKQEFWIERHLAATGCGVGIGIGGSLDVYAGNVVRAPASVPAHGPGVGVPPGQGAAPLAPPARAAAVRARRAGRSLDRAQSGEEAALMRAMILAGGMSTRLYPLTKQVPKPIVPVAGEPISGHVMRWLSSFGYDEVAINVFYLAELVQDTFGDGSRYGVKLHYLRERELTGSAGALKQMEGWFDGTFVVVGCDDLTDADLAVAGALSQRARRARDDRLARSRRGRSVRRRHPRRATAASPAFKKSPPKARRSRSSRTPASTCSSRRSSSAFRRTRSTISANRCFRSCSPTGCRSTAMELEGRVLARHRHARRIPPRDRRRAVRARARARRARDRRPAGRRRAARRAHRGRRARRRRRGDRRRRAHRRAERDRRRRAHRRGRRRSSARSSGTVRRSAPGRGVRDTIVGERLRRRRR